MPSKRIIEELREQVRRRGQVTKAQRAYALVEEQVMVEMYPMTKPHEEERCSHLRTLQSYTSDDALKMIINGNETLWSL